MTRRTFLPSIAAPGLAAGLSAVQAAPRKGRIKQAVCRGVFNQKGKKMSMEDMCKNAARLGAKGIDLVGPADFPMLKKYGLVPTMVPGGASIRDGINRKENHAGIDERMRKAIDDAAAAGAPNVIVMSGERKGMSDAEGADNAVLFLNNIKKYAEDKNVTLCIELLNSKVNHPDYMADHTKWGAEVCQRVGSPRVKLLYDIYHMQIMEGDVIRTVRDNIQHIGHFHTAGNPDRHEFDLDTQELNYRGIMLAIANLNYQGYVSHEYTPLRDPLKSLEEMMRICDV